MSYVLSSKEGELSDAMDPVEILHCIFLLGSLQFGQSYLVAGLSTTQQTMLPDLRDFGLVYHKVG
jgi:transcription initiation factor TFIIH subunit 4